MMFQSEHLCSPFPPPEGRDLRKFNQNTAVRLPLCPRVEIVDVSITTQLFGFPSARGLRLMMFPSEYSCSPFTPTEG